MFELTVELDEHPTADDFRTLIDGVRTFSVNRTGTDWPRPVACFLRDAERRIVGGVQGALWGRSMHVEVLWVDEKHRGSGYGSKLMTAIEDYAAAHGHPLVYLETTSFQALPFYERLGYRVFGELPEIAAGHTLFFLRRDLSSPIE